MEIKLPTPPTPINNPAPHESLDDALHPSIRETVLEGLPSYKALLEAMQNLANENNIKLAEELARGARELESRVFLVPESAEVAAFRFPAGFPIRHVFVRNISGATVYFSSGPINPQASASHLEFVTASFGYCVTAKDFGQPVNFGEDIFVRFGGAVTPTSTVYALVYVYSQPMNVYEFTP